MMFLTTITAEEFGVIGSAWIGSFFLVLIAGLYGVIKVAPLINQVRTLFKLHENNQAAITNQQDLLTKVALATVPLTSSPLIVKSNDDDC